MEQPHANHNVTDLTFGPDGLLYFASGDGGNPNRFTAPQDETTYIGKMLRVDPLSPDASGIRSTTGDFIVGANGEYRIPMSNPGVGVPIEVDEIYAHGLRSPYRLGFDRMTGDLYVGDVGEGAREEVSKITLDGNYGWGAWEGSISRDPSIVLAAGTTHSPPIFEYSHNPTGGKTVVGGFVYRGTEIPELQGKHLFADLGRQVTSGQAATPARFLYGDLATGEIREFNIDPTGELLAEFVEDELTTSQFIFGLGEDIDGEVYLVVGDDPQFPAALNPDGRILRVLATITACDFSGDGVCDVTDLDLMHLLGPIAPGVPATGNETFDLNGDGTINLDDRDQWLADAGLEYDLASPYKVGDANLDGAVAGQDFIAWNDNKFTNSLLWSHGDFTGDGVVDGQDFVAWNDNKFTSSDGSQVPEPIAPMLSVLGLCLLSLARMRR